LYSSSEYYFFVFQYFEIPPINMAKKVSSTNSGNLHLNSEGVGDLSHLNPTNKNPVSKIGNLSHLNPPAIAMNDIKQVNSGGVGAHNEWPLTKFAFEISIGGFTGYVSFQGMDGLGATIATMKFRDGNSKSFYEQSRPTLTSYDPVTLKKGVFSGDTDLFDWFSNVSQGSMFSDMRTVTIHLSELTGGGQTHMYTWTLEKAFVTKFTPSNLDGEADSELAIEEVELTYQSFSMNAGLLDGLLGGLLGSAVGAVSKFL
jgi:phage tail-like protein